jgi:hypothetical protein
VSIIFTLSVVLNLKIFLVWSSVASCQESGYVSWRKSCNIHTEENWRISPIWPTLKWPMREASDCSKGICRLRWIYPLRTELQAGKTIRGKKKTLTLIPVVQKERLLTHLRGWIMRSKWSNLSKKFSLLNDYPLKQTMKLSIQQGQHYIQIEYIYNIQVTVAPIRDHLQSFSWISKIS